jgi:hypothetical protein
MRLSSILSVGFGVSLVGCAHISSAPISAGTSEYYVNVTSGLLFKRTNVLHCKVSESGESDCYSVLNDFEAGRGIVSLQELRVKVCAEAAELDYDADKNKAASLAEVQAKVDPSERDACVEAYNEAWDRSNE